MTKTTATPEAAPTPPLEERIAEQKANLEAMQEQLKQQLHAVANQLYLIDVLLHPEKATPQGDPETTPEAVEAPEAPEQGVSTPEGTV